jgi:NADPH:quinone reductase-like Zn-dependent oxidoreductase
MDIQQPRDPYLIHSVAHAADVLRAFSSPAEILRLRDIVARTTYSKGIAFRLLYTLEKSGLVVELLRGMGAAHVLNSGDAGFDDELRRLCHKLGASISFESVAGEISGRVLRAQPQGSRMLVYGGLSLKAVEIDPSSLVFEGKHVEGFWLSAWLRHRNILGQLRVTRQVQELLAGDLKTEICARLPLEKAADGVAQYAANMTAGKVLLLPQTQKANG